MSALKLDSTLLNELKSLHQVVTKNFHSENELFEEYLTIGKKILNLETGIISRIKNETYTVLSFSSPLDGLEVGQLFSLEDTYCREVYEAKRTVAFPNVGSDKKMCNHPVYINMKLESYISAPIFVNDEIFGTINFTDREIRTEGFSSHQLELMEIMAKTISRFIEAQLMKKSLVDANEVINRLIGVVAHDLRSPLGSIISLSDLIKEETKEKEVKEYADLIRISSQNLMEMVGSILNMSAIECGKIKIVKSKNSLIELSNESWEDVKHLALKKSIRCEVKQDDFVVMFDKERMKQAFCNLFNNAIKFSNHGNTVQVSWSASSDKVLISIKDEGIGMTAEQIKMAFDPTATTSTTGTNGEVGTGYGLPLVERIVYFHGGSIRIVSIKDSGSEFTIELPIK